MISEELPLAKRTEAELLEIELSCLSISDLAALRDYTWNRPGTEWRGLCAKVNDKLMERAGKFLERLRAAEAEAK